MHPRPYKGLGGSMTNIKKCAIVVRVSDPRQAEKDRSSLENQKSEIETFIKMKNLARDGSRYERFDIYELEGVSGKHSIISDRFLDLKVDIIKGDVNVVICTDLDRLGRNVVEFVNFFKFLRDYHVDLVSTRLGLDTSTPTGEAIVVILMTMAQLENRIKSEKVLQARHERAKEGLFNGKRPILGYDLNPDPRLAGHLIVNEPEAEIVRLAFKLYLELGSDQAVSQRLTDLAYNNKAWIQRETRERLGGGPISPSVVKTLLTSIIYIGLQNVKSLNEETGKKEKKQLPGCWEPIVDDDLFHIVQEARRNTRKTRRNIAKSSRHFYLLREIVFCGFCDEAMSTGSGTSGSGGQRYYYYKCGNDQCSFFIGEQKRNKVDAYKADQSVYDAFGRIASNEENIRRIVKLSNEYTQVELPSMRVEKRRYGVAEKDLLSNIETKAAALSVLDSQSPAFSSLSGELHSLEDSLARVKNQRSELERSISQIESSNLTREEVVKRLRDLRILIDNAPEAQRRELLKLSCERVLIKNEDLELEFIPSSLIYTPVLTPRAAKAPRRKTTTPNQGSKEDDPLTTGMVAMDQQDVNGSSSGRADHTDMSTSSAEFVQIETWLPGEDLNLEPSG
jgi:site-specific DNA recombinase